MKNLSSFFAVAYLLMTLSCQNNPSTVDTEDSQTTASQTQEPAVNKRIIFSGNNQEAAALTPGSVLDWETQAKPMIDQQLAKESFWVKTRNSSDPNDSSEVQVIGFRIGMDVISDLMQDAQGNTRNLEAIYLIPAIRPCDLNKTNKYSTIIVGASMLDKTNREVLLQNDLRDYFSPCPTKCPEVIPVNMTMPSISTGHDVDVCL